MWYCGIRHLEVDRHHRAEEVLVHREGQRLGVDLKVTPTPPCLFCIENR
jgi:hypothetical protein